MPSLNNTPFPKDWTPVKVATPTSFEGVDLYPAVAVKATRAKIAKYSDVVEREDELGVCLVAHFTVIGTLIMFYQSALDRKNAWTVFVDMESCVMRKQFPTRLGNAVVTSLSAGSIVPDWVNDAADTVYRSRRRKLTKVNADIAQKTASSRSNRDSGRGVQP